MWQGELIAIYITPAAGQPTAPQFEVQAVAGCGLVGDRYFAGNEPGPKKAGPDREVTLIAIEALEALRQETGVELAPAAARRNLVTRGAPLNDLVGCEFQVGDVRLRGVRLCEPCNYLAGLTQPEVLKGLVHRGGLRAAIVSSGMIRVGDKIEGVG